jgi:hypothetical protein
MHVTSSEPLLQLDDTAAVVCWLLALVIGRSVMPALWLMAAPSAGRWLKGLLFVLFGAGLAALFAWGGGEWLQLGVTCAGLLYFALIAWLACMAVERGTAARVTKPALFGSCALSFMLVPGLVLPAASLKPVLAIGFEMMLSTFSFVVEARQTVRRPARSDAMFFLVVNPTLVYAERGRKLELAAYGRGVARIAAGIAGLAGTYLLARAFVHVMDGWPSLPGRADPSLRLIVAGAFTYATTYFGQSGVASLQLGWMRLLGWEVPERYCFPFLATSPSDFWQRWNTYFGAWLRRYAFQPIALYGRRHHAAWPARFTTDAAVLATFVASGLLHDYAAYPGSFDFPIGATLGFTCFGLGFIVWQSSVRRCDRLLAVVPRRVRALAGAVALLPLLSLMHQLMVHGANGALPVAVGEWLGLPRLGV